MRRPISLLLGLLATSVLLLCATGSTADAAPLRLRRRGQAAIPVPATPAVPAVPAVDESLPLPPLPETPAVAVPTGAVALSVDQGRIGWSLNIDSF